MNRFELVIFDLDGTLIDSQTDLANAVNHVRSSHKMPLLSVSEVRAFVGDGIKVLMKRSLPGLTEPLLLEATNDFRSYYGKHLLENTVLFPGVLEMLKNLRGIQKAVLTNKPEALAAKILKGLKIDGYLASLSGGDSSPKKKPDPQPVFDIINKLSSRIELCAIVGDGKNDILAAKAAGVTSIAVSYGYTAPAELKALCPDFMVGNLSELCQLLQG